MQSIIASLASRHGLSRAEVLLEVESAFSALLSRWYRREVLVHFRQDLALEAVAYARVNGIVHQRVIDLPALLGRARFSDFLEQRLETAGVCGQVRPEVNQHLPSVPTGEEGGKGGLDLHQHLGPGQAVPAGQRRDDGLHARCPLERLKDATE